ncbi:NAD(P)-dependent oxidoreductase, partial [Rhizobiaceae sp. 2RAB30]
MNTTRIAARKVAFVGLGSMGTPMALRLAEAGVDLAVHDANTARMEEFPKGQRTATAVEAVRDADALILMLPDGKIMQDVLLGGRDGVAETLKRGSIVIDMGSSDPYLTREVGSDLAERGVRMIDAPVSG